MPDAHDTETLAEVLAAHAACGYTISQTGDEYWATYECGPLVQIHTNRVRCGGSTSSPASDGDRKKAGR